MKRYGAKQIYVVCKRKNQVWNLHNGYIKQTNTSGTGKNESEKMNTLCTLTHSAWKCHMSTPVLFSIVQYCSANEWAPEFMRPTWVLDRHNLKQCLIKAIYEALPEMMLINSLWPSEDLWWHRSGSMWAQVMACCLTAPSHYLNHSDNHLKAILQGIPQPSTTKISLKFCPNLPGTNELIVK